MGLRERLQGFYLDTLRGGMTINTPAAKPILRTVIQFDGDIQNMVCCGPDGALPEAAVLQPLFLLHRAALQRRLDELALWPRGAKLARLAASGIAASGSLYALLELFRNQGFRLHFIMLLLCLTAPFCLRLAAPWAIRAALKIAAGAVIGEIHIQNRTEIEKLRNRRTSKRVVPGSSV